MSKRRRLNGWFFFAHRRSEADAISVDRDDRSDENLGGDSNSGIGRRTLDAFVLKGKCHLCRFICNDEFIREPERV